MVSVGRIDAKVKNLGLPDGGLGYVGIAYDDDNHPMPHAQLFLFINDEPPIPFITDSKGRFKVKLESNRNLRIVPE